MRDIYLLKIDSNEYSVIKGQVETKTVQIGNYKYKNYCLKSPELIKELSANYVLSDNECYDKEKLDTGKPMLVIGLYKPGPYIAFSFIEPDERVKNIFINSIKQKVNDQIEYANKELAKIQKKYDVLNEKKENRLAFINYLDEQLELSIQDEELERE